MKQLWLQKNLFFRLKGITRGHAPNIKLILLPICLNLKDVRKYILENNPLKKVKGYVQKGPKQPSG